MIKVNSALFLSALLRHCGRLFRDGEHVENGDSAVGRFDERETCWETVERDRLVESTTSQPRI